MTLAVNWSNPSTQAQIQLFRPSGVAVLDTDADAHIKEDSTHTVFRLDAPEAGQWELQVMLVATVPDPQEYFVTASAHTDPTMLLTLGLPPADRVVRAAMPIYVVLSEPTGTIKNATVELHTRQPGGVVKVLTGYDDGSHGDHNPNDGVYTTVYDIPRSGNYRVKAVAAWKDSQGETVTRYQTRHFHVIEQPSIAYIYEKDTDIARAYQNLLERNGLSVTLVPMDKIENTKFSEHDLLIIGPDTGKDANWGTAAQVDHLSNTSRRVIGLGDGGHAFFGQVGLDIGYNNGTASTDTSVIPVDVSHPIWQTPFDLAVTGVTQVYAKNGSDGVAVWGHGNDLVWLASDPPNSTPLWLVLEEGRYLIWGFNRGPRSMSTTGKSLFVNTVWFMVP